MRVRVVANAFGPVASAWGEMHALLRLAQATGAACKHRPPSPRCHCAQLPGLSPSGVCSPNTFTTLGARASACGRLRLRRSAPRGQKLENATSPHPLWPPARPVAGIGSAHAVERSTVADLAGAGAAGDAGRRAAGAEPLVTPHSRNTARRPLDTVPPARTSRAVAAQPTSGHSHPLKDNTEATAMAVAGACAVGLPELQAPGLNWAAKRRPPDAPRAASRAPPRPTGVGWAESAAQGGKRRACLAGEGRGGSCRRGGLRCRI